MMNRQEAYEKWLDRGKDDEVSDLIDAIYDSFEAQLNLTSEYFDLIYDALITEIEEQKETNKNYKQRGRNTKLGEDRLDKLRLLKLTIEPYTF